ncbi:hypothetical protein ccbrp13_30230 [Ktedonobacteria bacterium brp13]|nr:hypothetical protein ccbrp13_30230 [Ktedonobacteria bacterium brp13]
MYVLPYGFKSVWRHALCGLCALLLLSLMLFHAPHVFASTSLPYGGNRLAIQTTHSSQMRMQPSQLGANLFTFTGVHTFITYNMASTQFYYQGPQGKQTWSGNNVNVQDSPLGTLITVFFPGNPDVGIVSLTVLLPAVDLISNAPAHFETFAMYAHHRGFILIPPARLTYTTIALHGTAQP